MKKIITNSKEKVLEKKISKTRTLVGLFFSVLIFISTAKSQNVGINSTGASPAASAMLDITSTSSGFLMPRVALLSTTDVVTISSPATSLLVYNTNASMTSGSIGFWYYDGTQWQMFYTTATTQWTLTGNTGTVPGTNFLGTTDAKDLVFKTTNVERMRFLSTGMAGINITPTSTEMLTVAGGSISGINITTANTSATGYALHAVDTTTDEVFLGYTGSITIAGNPYKKPVVYANAPLTAGSGGTPAIIASSSGTNIASAIIAYSSVSCGLLAYCTLSSNAAAVWGQNTNSSGTGVIGVGNNLGNATYAPGGSGGSFKGDSVGAFGYETKTHGFGVYGQASGTSATGVVGAGNAINNPTVLSCGAGGAFNGDSIGAFSYSTKGHGYGFYAQAAGASSTGIVGIGNNSTPGVLSSGSGAAFFGTTVGLYAATTNNAANPSASIEMYNAINNTFEYLNYYNGTNYKILEATVGSVSCAVKDLNGKYVVMHCAETPEFYFQDYGQGKLVNGSVHINLDPILAKNVAISSQHPLRVFIQLEDNENCKGVVVKNKTATGFDVVELNGGTSNTPFTYTIVCNVADAEMPSGVMSKFQDLRFEKAPDNPKVIQGKLDLIQHNEPSPK